VYRRFSVPRQMAESFHLCKRQNERVSPQKKTLRSPSENVKNLTLDPRATGMSSGIGPVHHFYCPPRKKKSTWLGHNKSERGGGGHPAIHHPRIYLEKYLRGLWWWRRGKCTQKGPCVCACVCVVGYSAGDKCIRHTTNIKGASSGRI
jgi:hypothetical protein